MPMGRDRHEEILNQLLLPDLEQSTRTELLQELRADYGGVLTDFTNLNQERDKLRADNSDLVVANSKLFRQQAIVNPEDKKKEDEKTLSETITIEAIERGEIS